jgi:gamma-glutamyltranspeptidase/glutathione hydrolase
VLSAGGTAADAAVAMGFALSVTMPSSASLGGGGVCVVHDWKTKKTETLDFLARPPRAVPPGATRPTAVPGNPRGFFALHSRFGRLRWESLIGTAEGLARFGTPVSRAFANDLAQVGDALLADAETRRIFGQNGGNRLPREGDTLIQFELASMLGQIRRAGPGDFYDGPIAHQFVAAVNAAGGSLDIDDLRAYRPVWRETIRVPYGNRVAHFISPPGAAGGLEAQMWQMLATDDRFEDGSPAVRDHLLAETAMRAFADRGRWLKEDGTTDVKPGELAASARVAPLMATYREDHHTPAAELAPPPVERLENPSATSFVVVDRDSSAVACALTMNNLFGTGR